MKTVTVMLTLFFSLNSYGLGKIFPGLKKQTVRTTRNIRNQGPKASNGINPNSPYGRIYNGLDAIEKSGSLSCNQSYRTASHALVCNCANEAGNQSLAGMRAVSRVVFSRMKSQHYPGTVQGVVCQRHQFSWTIGGWNSQCTRTRGNPTYFNSPTVSGVVLRKCVRSAQQAARIELQEQPEQLFALNYCSTNRSAYRNAIPRWCRTLMNTQAPIDDHVFGFANGNQRYLVPARTPPPPPGSISYLERFFKLPFFFNEAFAVEQNDFKITNSKVKQRLEIGGAVRAILDKKYKNFKPYKNTDYQDSVKKLMVNTRFNLPASAIGDYNGDGKEDLILMGSSTKKHVVLAFLSYKKGYRDIVVSVEPAYKKPLDVYVVNISKKKIKFKTNKPQDAFQIERFGGAAVAKFFDGKKFANNTRDKGFVFK